MTIYLCVKQHSITKLKYFCRTIRKNPLEYKGSGTRWTNHLQKHPGKIITLEIHSFETQEEATEFAIAFSYAWKIVESNEWANLIIEDGKAGGGVKGRPQKPEHTKKLALSRTGNINSNRGRPLRIEHIKRISEGNRGKVRTVEQRQKHSLNYSGEKNPQYGSYWITNGIDNKKMYEIVDFLPTGWYRGRSYPNGYKKR